jgi:hypothetical protein
MAIFLDRPLSADKGPAEPDDSLLFSYLAFSRFIASDRLGLLSNDSELLDGSMTGEELREQLARMEVRGLSIRKNVDCSRTAIVSLADALRTSDDFVLLRATNRPWFRFALAYFSQAPLKSFALKPLHAVIPELVVRHPKSADGLPHLMIYDHEIRPRMELSFDPSQGYVSRNGIEYPAGPLRILRVWEQGDDGMPPRQRDLSGEMVLLDPPIL